MTKRIRYLTTLMLLLAGSTSLWAQDDDPFNPASPAEPGPSGNVPMLTLIADPADGGTVSGAGWYEAGTKVTLRAYNKQNYVFDKWINANGETVSTASQFQYTKLAVTETLTACFRFSPGSPAEPTEIAQQIYHQLTLVAEDGGTVSGGGKYMPGTRVQLSASLNTGYVFRGWYDEDGALVSSSTSFYYTTLARAVTLTARFAFNPGSPSEPSEPNILPKHSVTVTAEDGGTVNTGGATLEEGKTIALTATINAGYVFSGWYVADTLYSSKSSFTYTMGKADIAFVARFVFSPSGPGEPSMPSTDKRFTFYLMNKVTKPGATVQYPIYLTSFGELHDMDFQLTFPASMVPSLALDDIAVSDKAEGYTLSASAVNDSIYNFKLLGGSVPDGNTSILTFTVHIPGDIATGQGYPIKINQVTITEVDGSATTATTRNGRISVYKNGDANGDDAVDTQDAIKTTQYYLKKNPEEFIEEAADSNYDSIVDTQDVIKITKIYLKKE